jgi:hypothetical protein
MVTGRHLCVTEETDGIVFFIQFDNKCLLEVFQKRVVRLFPVQVANHIFFLFNTRPNCVSIKPFLTQKARQKKVNAGQSKIMVWLRG